jgi:hypothetical protein
MPSTYSSLKFELIAPGEQAGTWGATTNANIGTAIEEAITGSSDIVFSGADVTLTLDNTTTAQAARGLRLNLVGTSGGARQLILGAGCQINKFYLIQNNLAHAVTLRNPTGTGVTVDAGATRYVFNNGTNVIDATPDRGVTSVTASAPLASSGGATPNISFTGTLPVANGGTGRTTLASGGLVIGAGTGAVNTLTGTSVGQIPQWNGSTWTTGSLPSGGVTNVTASAPLSSSGGGTPNITFTGTLAVANGGTGQSGTPTNGQLLIGTGSGFSRATLTAGTGISITNGSGAITIAATGGGVTSFSAGTTGLTPSTGTTGAVTLAGTLALANGGTGATTAANARTNLGLGTAATMTGPSGTIVGTTDTQTLTSKTFGNYTETIFAITDGTTVNLNPNNGPIQTWTLGANRTPGQASWAAGQSLTLMIDDGSARTINWSTLAVVWKTNGGVAPTLQLSGFTVIELWKVGTTIYGARVGNA